jgi:uncharacterized membrane protein
MQHWGKGGENEIIACKFASRHKSVFFVVLCVFVGCEWKFIVVSRNELIRSADSAEGSGEVLKGKRAEKLGKLCFSLT